MTANQKRFSIPLIACGILAISLSFSSCGKNAAAPDTSAAVASLSTALASLAITSPTAKSSGSSVVVSPSGFGVVADGSSGAADVKPMSTMVTEFKADLAAADPKAIAAKIGKMEVTRSFAECFGPAWTDNTTNGLNRPGGDLGMVYITASLADTTPCAAAQLNALMAGTPQFANKLVKMQATLVTALGAAGTALPAIGESVDGLTSMPTVTGVTFTAAKLERLVDIASDSTAVYKTTFGFTNATGKASSVVIIHNPKNTDNTNFVGYLKATLPEGTVAGASTVAYRGISLVYQQTDGVLTFALDSAQNRATSSTDFFSTTSGRVDYAKTAFGNDANRIVASFNQNTGAATMHYAWQAGSGDGASRSFAVTVDAAGAGKAYFGYGDAINIITDSTSTLWADRMYCDWIGANGHLTDTNNYLHKLQSQSFTKSTAGVFSIVAADSHIAFAPTVTSGQTSVCDGTFTISASTQGGSSTPSFLLGTRVVTANDLVAPPATGTIPPVTVPTLPFTP